MQLILLTRYLLSRLGFRLMSQESTGTSLGRLFGQAIIMFITPLPSTRLRVTALNILRRPPEIVKHPVPVSELVSGAGLLVQLRVEQRWRHIQPAPAPHLSALRLETAGVRLIPSNPAKCQPSMSQRSALPSLTAMVQYAEGSCSSVDFLPIFLTISSNSVGLFLAAIQTTSQHTRASSVVFTFFAGAHTAQPQCTREL